MRGAPNPDQRQGLPLQMLCVNATVPTRRARGVAAATRTGFGTGFGESSGAGFATHTFFNSVSAREGSLRTSRSRSHGTVLVPRGVGTVVRGIRGWSLLLVIGDSASIRHLGIINRTALRVPSQVRVDIGYMPDAIFVIGFSTLGRRGRDRAKVLWEGQAVCHGQGSEGAREKHPAPEVSWIREMSSLQWDHVEQLLRQLTC